MVYGGKPSTGCKNCRRRKIKCDEQRPACTQCTTSNRLCPGYAHLFDLVLRDQTESVSRKAQQRRSKRQPASNTNHQRISADDRAAKSNSSLQSSGRLPPSFALIATSATTGYSSLPISLDQPPEQLAINAWMSNYVSFTRQSYSSRGYLDFLLPLYQNTRHDSLLSLATIAMALAIQGGSPRFQHYRQLSHSYFGKALLKASKAIRDPVESVQDDTLMSVLILSFYEVGGADTLKRVLAASEATPISGVHDSGAVALVKHRGKQNGTSELSARLLLAVQTQVVDHCIETSAPFGKTSADLDSLRPTNFENAASRLTSLSARLTDLMAFANPILRSCQLPSTDQLAEILNYASDVEAQVSTWPSYVPEDWRYKPSHTFDDLPSYESKLYVYNRRCDIYQDIWIASTWNSYRSTQLVIQYLILQTLAYLNPDHHTPLGRRIFTAICRVQEMCDDICASVPFNLGNKTFGGPFDRKEVRYPDDGVSKPTDDYRKSAAGLGGRFLIEPLKTAKKAICLREGQSEWIGRQIERIQRIHLLKKPVEVEVEDMPSPKCPGGR
ncbi:MAG: hypothetical protein LQ352_008093 [Teloschistes flavicans]|nr:MAG: hypothetical protein LQ352_008093 [Teloschistes flavicans]